jgi:hypothetical protein
VIGLSSFLAAIVGAGGAVFSAACPDAAEQHGVAPSDYVEKSLRRAKSNIRRVRDVFDELTFGNGTLPAGVLDVNDESSTGFPKLPPRVDRPLRLDLTLPSDNPAPVVTFNDRELWGCSSCELLPELMRRSRDPWWVDAGNGLFTIPEAVFDVAVDFGRACFPSAPSVSLKRDSEGPLIPRLFALQLGGDLEAPFADALTRWVAREQEYFAGFHDNPAFTFLVEEGLAEPDHDDLIEGQRRIALDALRKTYLGKYVVRLEERVRDEAYRFNQWSGVDFLLGPPVIAAYTYIRGFERRVKVGDFRLRMHLEPLRRIADARGDDEDDLVGALGFELGFGEFPIKAIVSFGYHNGHAEMDFVGIGTSLGEARKAVRMILDIEEPKDR